LEVASHLAGFEIDRNQRVGVEVVAGSLRAVEVRRGIADREVDALGGEIDRGILPHAATEGLVGITGLAELLLLGRDVAMQVATGCILRRPDADRVLRNRVEGPKELAVIGVVGLEEAADAVFAA